VVLGLLTSVDPFKPDSAAFLFTWVAAGHAIQYLWITSYYFGVRGRRQRWSWYARCVFAGSAIWSLPVIAYAWTGLAGSRFGGVATAEDAGVLLAAMVNIHHFMIDGAIWKLRDGKVARALIRREAAEAPEAIEPPRRRWLAPALLTAGALWAFTTVGSLLERERILAPAIGRGDAASAEASLRRLSWMRRATVNDYHDVARVSAERGDAERALRVVEGAIRRHGRPMSYQARAAFLAQLGRNDEAAAAWEEGLAVAPDDAQMLYGLGRLRLEQGRVEEARSLLERATAADPEDRRITLTLERARAVAQTASGDGA
jgi:tetratricopeptide (TPR) repeat protein